jgi:integrase
VKGGSVRQRHTAACPRDENGKLVDHRCRGLWDFSLDAGRYPNGKRRQLTRGGFATKADARAALRKAAQQLSEGIDGDRALTTGVFLQQWLAGKRALRPSTVKSYREHLELYLLPHLGHIRLLDLRSQHVDEMVTAMLAAPRKRPLSPMTVKHVHATLRTALNSAVRRRLIPYNPALPIELPEVTRTPVVVWTPAQVRAFLDAASEDRLYPLFHLVVVTGMRRGEVVGLRLVDVDLDNAVVRVSQQMLQLGGRTRIGAPKTKSGARTVPIDPTTVRVLREHLHRQVAERRAWGSGWVETGLAFTRENGSALSPEMVSRRFALLSRRAGLPKVRFHGLRHTSASLALAAGVAMKTVSDRLGHSTTSITADLYTHVSPAVASQAAEAIADIISGREGRRPGAPGP